MVDSVGSNLPPSVQAVNKARSNAQTQKSDAAQSSSDELSLSAEAQELTEVNRLATETRDLLAENQNETLGRGENLNELL